MAAPAKKTAAKAPKAGRLYEVKGADVTRKNKSCPKCGQGYFLAIHKNRISCGKCAYTEMKK